MARGAELSARDLHRVLDFTDRLIACEDPADFTRHAASALRDLVPCDFASFNEINPRDQSARFCSVPGDVLFDGIAEAFGRNVGQHPIVSHYSSTTSPRARRLSEFISRRQFHALRLYDEVFKPLDNDYLLTSPPVVLPDPVIIGFAMHRGSRDFSEREQALVDLASPFIAHAYAAFQALATVKTLEAALDHDRPIVIVDADRRVIHFTGHAPELLCRCLGVPISLGSTLPIPLPALGTSGTRGAQGDLGWECTRWQTYTAVVFNDMRAGAPRAPRGLSDRESEVLALVAEGKTNAQISDELFISVHTVRSHLETIYRKLDVHTRSAATAAFYRSSQTDDPASFPSP